jgi:hypothetical protein
MMDHKSIFESLKDKDKAGWRILASTYGNCHATTIGLLSRWWVSLGPEGHQVLDGAPSPGGKTGAAKIRRHADLLLCDHRKPVGVVEVEGTRWEETAAKFEPYFQSPNMPDITFGILVMYGTGMKGGVFKNPQDSGTTKIIERITGEFQGKAIILISLEKALLNPDEGILWKTESRYYLGKIAKVSGSMFRGGKRIREPEEFILR